MGLYRQQLLWLTSALPSLADLLLPTCSYLPAPTYLLLRAPTCSYLLLPAPTCVLLRAPACSYLLPGCSYLAAPTCSYLPAPTCLLLPAPAGFPTVLGSPSPPPSVEKGKDARTVTNPTPKPHFHPHPTPNRRRRRRARTREPPATSRARPSHSSPTACSTTLARPTRPTRGCWPRRRRGCSRPSPTSAWVSSSRGACVHSAVGGGPIFCCPRCMHMQQHHMHVHI